MKKRALTATSATRYNVRASLPARPEVVPTFWQRGGPILVASDSKGINATTPLAGREQDLGADVNARDEHQARQHR